MKIRILLADDHAVVRRGFRMILDAQSDMEVVGEVSNGREAVEAATAIQPDIVVMDVTMPELDGVEATRWIKSIDQFKKTPVVMITGRSEKQKVIESLQAGAADFIVKPFDQITIVGKVHKLLPEQP